MWLEQKEGHWQLALHPDDRAYLRQARATLLAYDALPRCPFGPRAGVYVARLGSLGPADQPIWREELYEGSTLDLKRRLRGHVRACLTRRGNPGMRQHAAAGATCIRLQLVLGAEDHWPYSWEWLSTFLELTRYGLRPRRPPPPPMQPADRAADFFAWLLTDAAQVKRKRSSIADDLPTLRSAPERLRDALGDLADQEWRALSVAAAPPSPTPGDILLVLEQGVWNLLRGAAPERLLNANAIAKRKDALVLREATRDLAEDDRFHRRLERELLREDFRAEREQLRQAMQNKHRR